MSHAFDKGKAFAVFDEILVGDLDEIVRLEGMIANGWTRQMIFDAHNSGTSQFLKAQKETKIVGFVNYSTILDEVEINSVVVTKEFQRRGIAALMLDRLEQLSKDKGIKSIFLEVNEQNLAAIRLYEKCGYQKISVRKNYYGSDSAFIYQKALKNEVR